MFFPLYHKYNFFVACFSFILILVNICLFADVEI